MFRSTHTVRPCLRSGIPIVALVAACFALLAPAARADHPSLEGPLPAAEVEQIGVDHALDHSFARKPKQLAGENDGPSYTPANSIAGGSPQQVGRWVGGPGGVIDLPTYAIHAVMLPTGKVLFWGYPPAPEGGKRPNGGEAALWDPSKGTGPRSIKEVDPPLLDPDGPDGPQEPVPAPLYCSGQTLLPNGDVLATGGNLVWPDQYGNDQYGDYSGLNTIYVFDPFGERWVKQPNMSDGRWYPSQVLLGDGRTVILGGYNDDPSPPGVAATDTQIAEIFRPGGPANGAIGSVTQVGDDPDFRTALYPHLFTLPSNQVLLAGPAAGDSARFTFEPGQSGARFSFESPPDRFNRIGGTGVLEPSGFKGSWTALQFGGYDDRQPENPSADPSQYVYRATSTSVKTNGKKLQTSLNNPSVVGRSYQNTVLLPNGSMVTLGGGAGRDPNIGNYFTDDQVALKRVEVYNPKTRNWTLGPNQREYRAYHSTAVLLPDGRVWSAGDDYHAIEPKQNGGGFKASTKDTAELYMPPYLFYEGKRPKIKSVSSKLGYGDTFGVKTAKGRGKSAVLMAPSATTHGADMHQRLVTLKKKKSIKKKGLVLKTPKATGVAPPGYYMLFVMNGNGKPSVAEWVKLEQGANAKTLKAKKKKKKKLRCNKLKGKKKKQCKRKKRRGR